MEGEIVCQKCSLDFCSPLPSRCYICKQLTDDSATCRTCRRKSDINNLWVTSDYNENAKKLIYELKFACNRSAAKTISMFLAETLPLLPDDTVVVNIPTATSRVRLRSFDHTKLIAKNLSNNINIPYLDALARIGQSRQVGSKRTERTTQLKGSFYVRKSVADKRVLLVDDIVTTGSTLEVAAKELRKSGAKKIYAVTFAQK